MGYADQEHCYFTNIESQILCWSGQDRMASHHHIIEEQKWNNIKGNNLLLSLNEPCHSAIDSKLFTFALQYSFELDHVSIRIRYEWWGQNPQCLCMCMLYWPHNADFFYTWEVEMFWLPAPLGCFEQGSTSSTVSRFNVTWVPVHWETDRLKEHQTRYNI